MGIERKTKSVKALENIFNTGDHAWSVVDLIEKLSDQMNKTTVYRILGRFEDEGFLHSFNGKNGLKWYAKCKTCSTQGHSDEHPHFQCNQCGKIECVSVKLFEPSIPDYKIEHMEILLTGKCSDCQ